MKLGVLLATAAFSAGLLGAVQANAGVITFDSYVPQNGCGGVSTGGIDFASAGSICTGVWTNNPVSTNGTPGLIYGFGGIVMTATGGGEFNLADFLAGISWYSAQTSYVLTATATYADLSTASGTFTIGQGFQSYVMGGGFYKKLEITGLPDGYVALDNMNFTVKGVPEPATWALMLLGFGAIGATARRRRVVAA